MTRLLLELPDAWATLGISRSTLYELIKAGAINTVKIGRRTLIAHDELERYVRALQCLTTEPGPAAVNDERPDRMKPA